MTKFDHNNPRPLPDDYPLFEVTDVELSFSTASGHIDEGGRYLNFYEGQTNLVPREYQRLANTLFFDSKTPEEIGLSIRPEYDKETANRAIHYLLTSWDPKHEEKVATVAFALSKWYEGLPNV